MTLNEYRKEHALSLTALAALLGSKPSTVHGWLNGHRRPSWLWLGRIAEKTGGKVRPNDFGPEVATVGTTSPDAAIQALGVRS